MNVYQQLTQALERLEAAMEAAGLWQMATPPASAFESSQPFCVDTMSLPEWLRFVFIARLQALADAKGALPASCDVAPAVEAYLANVQIRVEDRRRLCQVVADIDRLVTES